MSDIQVADLLIRVKRIERLILLDSPEHQTVEELLASAEARKLISEADEPIASD